MIPLCEPNLTGRESEYVADAIASGWVSGGGSYVERFEDMVAKACGKEWAVATLTGTAALHVMYLAHGAERESPLNMRSMTFIATANAATYLGMYPHFCDIEDDWTPDLSWVGGEFGIMDAACSIGETLPEGMGAISFNGNKTITAGQGGAVVGDDPEDEKLIRWFVNACKSSPYEYNGIGFNYRMPNLNAAMGCAQMERLIEFRGRKLDIMRRYKEAGIELVQSQWMALGKFENRDELIGDLRRSGVDARPFWTPLHLQGPYMECPRDLMPNTEAIWEKLVCLPCSTSLTEDQQDRVIKCVEYLR